MGEGGGGREKEGGDKGSACIRNSIIMYAGCMLPAVLNDCEITITADIRHSPPQRTSGDVLLSEDEVSDQQDQQSSNLNLSTHWPAMRETPSLQLNIYYMVSSSGSCSSAMGLTLTK